MISPAGSPVQPQQEKPDEGQQQTGMGTSVPHIHQRVFLFLHTTLFCCVAGLAISAESSCASYVSATQEFEQLCPLISSNQALKF